MRSERLLTYGVAPLTLFSVALVLRLYFFSGFILCDDVEEYALIEQLALKGPTFQGHLQYRFMMWWLNVLFFRLFGPSEGSFFLPTLLMSSSLSVVGYGLLLRNGYARGASFLGGLLVATAPFEILLGTLRANDLILAWLLALALLAFVPFGQQPGRQGVAVAFLLWLAFYTKLWAVYVLPALGVHYLAQVLCEKEKRGVVAFVLTSASLHAATALYWKARIGVFLPFVTAFSATYPVEARDLPALFLRYPRNVFVGSEFGTTLFGYVPHLLCALVATKTLLWLWTRKRDGRLAFDRLDAILLAYYVSFGLLLNFVPNHFVVDRYYSAPRIFRYLAPVSFPMTVHAGKILLDIGAVYGRGSLRPYVAALLWVVILAGNGVQAAEASRPGRTQRRALLAVVADIRTQCPPRVLCEAWQSFFLRQVYLKGACAPTSVPGILRTHSARDYERWLADHQGTLPTGTTLITGVGSCVHYGCHGCGFRLREFSAPLSAEWALVEEYAPLDYVPRPEPVRLWRLTQRPAPQERGGRVVAPEEVAKGPAVLFAQGMTRFDASEYVDARRHFAALLTTYPDSAMSEDAAYFHAVSFWREGDAHATVTEFSKLLDTYPDGRWAAGAHYHIGLAYKDLGNVDLARQQFVQVMSAAPPNDPLSGLARDQLQELPRPSLWEQVRTWWVSR